MKLTITIPNRNRDWFLDRSIYLLSKQTLPQEYWELIIVDDGSTDYSDDVITKYKKMGIIKNFHYIRNTKKREKSGNCAITRNIGAKFGTGDYILFTDPEVMMMPDWALQHYLAHKVDIVIRPGTGFYIPAVSISSLDIVSSCNLPDTTNRDVIGYCLQPRYYHVVDRDNVKNCQGRLLGDAYNDYDWRDIVGTWNSMENKIKNVQKKFVLSDNQILSE